MSPLNIIYPRSISDLEISNILFIYSYTFNQNINVGISTAYPGIKSDIFSKDYIDELNN